MQIRVHGYQFYFACSYGISRFLPYNPGAGSWAKASAKTCLLKNYEYLWQPGYQFPSLGEIQIHTLRQVFGSSELGLSISVWQ